MLRSMTAFGRVTKQFAFVDLTIEISSINRRFLEVKVQLPVELRHFEPHVVKTVGTAIGRGSVAIKIFAEYRESSPIDVKPNLILARQIAEASREICCSIGIENYFVLTTELLVRSDQLISFTEKCEEEENYKRAFDEALSEAIKPLLEMKYFEGKKIGEDLEKRLTMITTKLDEIEQLSMDAVQTYRGKLMERLKEFLNGFGGEKDILAREIALFAEKIDIAEEIIRLRSHTEQFRDYMKSDESIIGKTLDFISQEMLRETNTIGSKSQSAEVAHRVVEIKSEIERIREQVQNVE